MGNPIIIEVWITDPNVAGGKPQCVYWDVLHPNPYPSTYDDSFCFSGSDPIVWGNEFTPGGTVVITICWISLTSPGFYNSQRLCLEVNGSSSCSEWMNVYGMIPICATVEVTIGAAVTSFDMNVWTEVLIDGEIVENDREDNIHFVATGVGIDTTLSIGYDPLRMIDEKVILPQTIRLFGTLETVGGVPLPNMTIDVYRYVNTDWKPEREFLGSVTTDSNGNWEYSTEIDTIGYYIFEVEFTGYGVYNPSNVMTPKIDTSKYASMTIPYPANAWTDNPDIPGATWDSGPNGSILLSTLITPYEGDYSLQLQVYNAEENVFTLTMDELVNCNSYPFSRVAVFASDDTKVTDVILELVDVNNQAMWTRLNYKNQYAKPGEWIYEENWRKLGIGTPQWQESTPGATDVFAWDSVKKIRVIVYCERETHYVYRTSIWIDLLHFSYEVPGMRALKVKVVDGITKQPIPHAVCQYGHPAWLPPTPEGKVNAIWVTAFAKTTDDFGLVTWTGLAPGLYGLFVQAESYRDFQCYVQMRDADGDLVTNPVQLFRAIGPDYTEIIKHLLILGGLSAGIVLGVVAIKEVVGT